MLSDVNCRSVWVRRNRTRTYYDHTYHSGVYTPTECQKACEFDVRCVAVNWYTYNHKCYINTKPDHYHRTGDDEYWWEHYDLVSRCNTTVG